MLTISEFELARNCVDECLKLEKCDIKNHILESLKNFMINLDVKNIQHRERISIFLNHQKTLFLNYDMNSDQYLLSKKDVEKCIIGMDVIKNIIYDFIRIGL
jgi:hypothetical protein